MEPEIFTRVRKSGGRARRVGCGRGNRMSNRRLSEQGKGLGERVCLGWEDPFGTFFPLSNPKAACESICSLLLSGEQLRFTPGQDFGSTFSFKVTNSSTMDTSLYSQYKLHPEAKKGDGDWGKPGTISVSP